MYVLWHASFSVYKCLLIAVHVVHFISSIMSARDSWQKTWLYMSGKYSLLAPESRESLHYDSTSEKYGGGGSATHLWT